LDPLPRLPMKPDWNTIDTVLLDMDGTLLDLNFDNHFWQTHLPRRYAQHHGRDHDEVRTELMARFKAHEGTLPWYSVDFWTEELALDLMVLKEEVAHLIDITLACPSFSLPHVRAASACCW
jgi:putative hydrolase of the HAD superfamily